MQICSALIRHYNGGVCMDMKTICQTEIKKGGAGGFREIMEKKTICQAQKMTKHDKGTIKFVHMTCVLYTS